MLSKVYRPFTLHSLSPPRLPCPRWEFMMFWIFPTLKRRKKSKWVSAVVDIDVIRLIRWCLRNFLSMEIIREQDLIALDLAFPTASHKTCPHWTCCAPSTLTFVCFSRATRIANANASRGAMHKRQMCELLQFINIRRPIQSQRRSSWNVQCFSYFLLSRREKLKSLWSFVGK